MICVSPYIYIYILFCQVLLIRGSAEFGCVGDGGNVSVIYIYSIDCANDCVCANDCACICAPTDYAAVHIVVVIVEHCKHQRLKGGGDGDENEMSMVTKMVVVVMVMLTPARYLLFQPT